MLFVRVIRQQIPSITFLFLFLNPHARHATFCELVVSLLILYIKDKFMCSYMSRIVIHSHRLRYIKIDMFT